MKAYNELIRHNGNLDLFRMVEMSILATANGYPFHIHAEGLRGTGKTTIMRSVKNFLPPITRIKNCIYNCHPTTPHCPEHRNLSKIQIANIGTEVIPCPFLEISHSSKIGTVVGSIDLSKITDKSEPVAALLPGIIPQAHRGILFIDEINRLADTSPELVDVLLDVMGTKPGRIQVEETGLPIVELPLAVTVWAASNPDEEPGALSQIRKQLADRFDAMITMGRPSEYQAVLNILGQKDNLLKNNLVLCPYKMPVGNIEDIVTEENIRSILAAIYVDFGLESLRAVEAMETAAGLMALIAGRNNIIVEDVIAIVPLVLSHRTDHGTITAILKYLENLHANAAENLKTTTTIALSPPTLPFTESKEKNTERYSYWITLWNRLRQKINFWFKTGTNAYAGTPSAGSTKSTSQQENKLSTNEKSPTNGTGHQKILDPLETTIIAPPHPAAPLLSLSSEEFVSHKDNKQNG